MSGKYVIAWSLEDGKTGAGTRYLSLNDAQAICDFYNARCPHMRHWPKPVESTADLDTQPIIPDDAVGEDTLIVPPTLDEGR